uniref:Uncharacterized protein n=1 Tax=Oryza rufipogon TaxID=4529 RepID=A0A0E0QHH6_ORYRU
MGGMNRIGIRERETRGGSLIGIVVVGAAAAAHTAHQPSSRGRADSPRMMRASLLAPLELSADLTPPLPSARHFASRICDYNQKRKEQSQVIDREMIASLFKAL